MTTQTDTKAIIAKAAEAAKYFETARRATGDTATGPREDGEPYVRLKDGRPDWVQDVVRKAHDDGRILPDDLRYEMIRDAITALAETPEDYDIEDFSEHVDAAIPAYTHELTAWLHSRTDRYYYCDEWAEEYDYQGTDRQSGENGYPAVLDLLRGGYGHEVAEVYAQVLAGLREAIGSEAE